MNVELKKYNKHNKFEFDISYTLLFQGTFDSRALFESHIINIGLTNLAWGYVKYDKDSIGDGRELARYNGLTYEYFTVDNAPYETFDTLEDYIAFAGIIRTNAETVAIKPYVYGNLYKYRYLKPLIRVYSDLSEEFEVCDYFRLLGVYDTIEDFKLDAPNELKVLGSYFITNPLGINGHLTQPENNKYYAVDGDKILEIQTIEYEKLKNIPVPVSGEDKLDEALDEFAFKVQHTKDKNRLVKGDVVSLFVDEQEVDSYFVEQDNRVADNIYDNDNPYSKDVSLIEYTKISQGDIIPSQTYSYYKDISADVIQIAENDERRISTGAEFVAKITANPYGTFIIFPASGDSIDFTGITYNPMPFYGRLIGYKREQNLVSPDYGRINNTGVYKLTNITIDAKFTGSNKNSISHTLPFPIFRKRYTKC